MLLRDLQGFDESVVPDNGYYEGGAVKTDPALARKDWLEDYQAGLRLFD